MSRFTLIVVLFSLYNQVCVGQATQPKLRTLAETMIKNKEVDLTIPKFWICQENHLHCQMAQCHLDFGTEIEGIAMRLQIEASAIRHYRNTPQYRKVWKPVLQQVEQKISLILSSTDISEAFLLEGQISNIYLDFLRGLVKQHGYAGLAFGDGPPINFDEPAAAPCAAAPAPSVAIRANPTGSIHYVAFGEWRLKQFLNKTDQVDWTQFVGGQGTQLTSGRYRFRVNWTQFPPTEFTIRIPSKEDFYSLALFQNGTAKFE